MHLTAEAWNISFVGIIFALGGLSLIAIVFTVVGHFFKRSSDKAAKKNIPTPPKSVPVDKDRGSAGNPEPVKRFAESNGDDEAETVAAIMSAVYAYAPAGSRILSVKKVEKFGDGDARRNWRLRNPQTIWRTRKG